MARQSFYQPTGEGEEAAVKARLERFNKLRAKRAREKKS
jgi:hypothetical protein